MLLSLNIKPLSLCIYLCICLYNVCVFMYISFLYHFPNNCLIFFVLTMHGFDKWSLLWRLRRWGYQGNWNRKRGWTFWYIISKLVKFSCLLICSWMLHGAVCYSMVWCLDELSGSRGDVHLLWSLSHTLNKGQTVVETLHHKVSAGRYQMVLTVGTTPYIFGLLLCLCLPCL